MSEWINWKGGACPIPDGTIVDVKYRSGHVRRSVLANVQYNDRLDDAGPAYWKNDGAQNDIVAYRLASFADEQADDFQGSALIKQAVTA